MLNSFWGKYGQQRNKSQVENITQPSRLYNLLYDDTKELQTLRVVNDEMIEVVYKHVEETSPVQININIFVACLTTCWARLRLYQQGLCQLQPEQVLYFDTDSIIFLQFSDQSQLPLGDYLGEFTSELSCQDQLNFDILKDNVIQEVTAPLEEPRIVSMYNPHKICRNVETKNSKPKKKRNNIALCLTNVL